MSGHFHCISSSFLTSTTLTDPLYFRQQSTPSTSNHLPLPVHDTSLSRSTHRQYTNNHLPLLIHNTSLSFNSPHLLPHIPTDHPPEHQEHEAPLPDHLLRLVCGQHGVLRPHLQRRQHQRITVPAGLPLWPGGDSFLLPCLLDTQEVSEEEQTAFRREKLLVVVVVAASVSSSFFEKEI